MTTSPMLLTLAEVSARLRGAMNDRQLKRAIKKHGVAYVRAGTAWLLTEEQFNELREALTCSPSGVGSRAALIRSVVRRSVPAKRAADSRSALLDLVDAQLQRRRRRS
jgi:hypothetical protein